MNKRIIMVFDPITGVLKVRRETHVIEINFIKIPNEKQQATITVDGEKKLARLFMEQLTD